MKLLTSKSDNTKAIMIGMNDDDIKTLRFMFDMHIVWGFYRIWTKGKGLSNENIQPLLDRFPEATIIGFFHSPKGFVPPYKTEDLDEQYEPSTETDLFNFLEE